MLFNANLLALAALLAVGVNAATSTASAAAPTSTSQIPPCVLTCVEAALKSTNGACTSITSPCVCTNTVFQQSAATCLQSKCSAADVAAAVQLQQSVCASASASGSATATGSSTETEVYSTTTGSSAPSGSPAAVAGTSSSTTSAATSTASKSAGDKITFGHANLFALAIGVIGGLMA